MSEWALFGLFMTLAYLMDYGIKPRQWRKWIGIAMMVLSLFAIFRLPFRFDETEVGLFYMIACIYGWSLFYNCGRFEDDEANL